MPSIIDHRHEAWRAFLLILASLLVRDCFAMFANIRGAVFSLTEFDKALTQQFWPSALAVLIIIYVAKNAHGIMIDLFSADYLQKLEKKVIWSALSWMLLTLVIISLALVPHLTALVCQGNTLELRCTFLIFFICFPNIFLFILDVFYIKTQGYDVSDVEHGKCKILRAIIREFFTWPPSKRNSFDGFKKIWLLEDMVSVLTLSVWGVLLWQQRNPTRKIILTVVALSIVLLVNSVLDYFLNCRYFFHAVEHTDTSDSSSETILSEANSSSVSSNSRKAVEPYQA